MHQISTQFTYAQIGSPTLYRSVLAAFVMQGTTLNRWCIANGINRQTAEKALRGLTTSRNALSLVEMIVSAASLVPVNHA